jgi:Zn finger protein HypA/HybF involved in hydrogenase expression
MHETIIAQKIIEKAKEQGSVKKIILEVGDLAHLPAEELKEALQKIVPWEIEVHTAKAEVKCKCGYTGEPTIIEHTHDMTIYECPKCGKMPAEVLSGEDIIIKDVFVE